MSALHFVFEGSPPNALFVEVETPDGRSINAGDWSTRADGLSELVIPNYYAGGYSDGVSDALCALRDNDEAMRAVRKFCLHWIDCPVCQGTGENTRPTPRDVALALMASLGARGANGLQCKTCYGEKIVAPAHALCLFIAKATGESK